MLTTQDPAALVDPDVRSNYAAVRLQRGWTWTELADDFDRAAAATSGSAGGIGGRDDGYRLLAAWARAEATDAREPGPEQREGTTPQPAQPGPKKRTATPASPTRTA